MTLTLKEWDVIANRLEPKVLSKYGKEEQMYLWALYGGLLQHMKDTDLSIDEVLVICEEKVLGKEKRVSENSERKSIQ